MKKIKRILTIWFFLLGCLSLTVLAEDSLVSARYNLKYYGDGGYILLPNGVELKELNKKDKYYVYDFEIDDARFDNIDIALTIYEPLASEIDAYEESPSVSSFDAIKKEHDYAVKPRGSDYQYIWAYGDMDDQTAIYTIDIINSAKIGYYKVTLKFISDTSLSQEDIRLAENLVEAVVDNSSYANEK